MQISDEDVKHCLEKVSEVMEGYELYSRAKGHSYRSVDDLEWYVGEHIDRKVTVEDLFLAADDKVIRGVFTALADGSYKIYLLAELPERERRFVKCKELFHVILDEDRCRSMDIYGHLELAAAAFSIYDNSPDSPVVWEMLAEIAAMEFLLPYKDRLAIIAGAEGNIDYANIARLYGVPQIYVENYLSEAMMAEFAKVC